MADFVNDKTIDDKEEKEEAGEGDDNAPAPEEESTATFTPVVQLETVEVKTHEEDEAVVYKQRAKLFVFGETLLDKGTGNKTWKERGVGEVKLLRHKENSRIRILMRQEKTMKVIVNHFLDPRIGLSVHTGSDKSWIWVAYDFSDNELVETTFAIRFSSSENAQEFKGEFTKAQKEMEVLLAGGDSKAGTEEADAAATAIESLTVKDAEKSAEETSEKGPSFIMPSDSLFKPLFREPTAHEVVEEIDNAFNSGKIHITSMNSDEITFAGLGEPLLRLDTLADAAKLIKQKRHGVPLRLKTNGLVPSKFCDKTAEVLKDAGIDMISVSLLADNANDYNKIMNPQNSATFADVCSFVISCAEKELDVTCTAVEQPGVNMKNVRNLAISLGARDFVSSKYFP
eukprot:gene34204-44187_t